MQTEFRVIVTATFRDITDRDNWYAGMKDAIANLAKSNAKRADMTADEYLIPDAPTVTEKVV